MPVTFSQSIFFKALWFVIVFFSFSCKEAPEITQPITEVSQYDGSYLISFICDDTYMANATIDILKGKIDAQNIQNINQQKFVVSGIVDDNGKLQFTTIKTPDQKFVEADGFISGNGMIKGTYQVADRNCEFLGFCFTKNKKDIITQYDGVYQLHLLSEGDQIASFKARIENGEFNNVIENVNNNSYTIEGIVSKDGRLILKTMFSNINRGLTVIGYIQNNGSVKGIYTTSTGKKGAFSGKKIDD
jgi:hypothetical protein